MLKEKSIKLEHNDISLSLRILGLYETSFMWTSILNNQHENPVNCLDIKDYMFSDDPSKPYNIKWTQLEFSHVRNAYDVGMHYSQIMEK